jgi:hypothetical protein
MSSTSSHASEAGNAGAAGTWSPYFSELDSECFVEFAQGVFKFFERLTDGPPSLSTLVHAVVKANVRFTASTNDDVTQACVSVANAVLKLAVRARNFERNSVQINHRKPVMKSDKCLVFIP